jgi:hypothetical protein
MLAPGAILQAMLQGAGPVGCYYKVLTGSFVTGSRSWVLVFGAVGRYDTFLYWLRATDTFRSHFIAT